MAQGQDNANDWPFVTLSSFQRRATSVKEQSQALYIGVYPIVERGNRDAWEDDTAHHPDALWYPRSVQYQEKLGMDLWDDYHQVQTDDPDLNLTGGAANRIYSLAKFQVLVKT